METPLTILYTYNLRGNLEVLPRLHTFIGALRRQERGRVVLLDLGHSCAPEVWHCAITGGRSMLVALDGMGYDAANASDAASDAREKLGGNVRLTLVDPAHDWWDGEICATLRKETRQQNRGVTIWMAPVETTQIRDGALELRPVSGLQVGLARLIDGALTASDILDLPPRTAPDPTIAGIVDFILSEARLAQKKRAAKKEP